MQESRSFGSLLDYVRSSMIRVLTIAATLLALIGCDLSPTSSSVSSFVANPSTAPSRDPQFWLGVATRDITPAASLINQHQIYLAGYGGRMGAANGVSDPISARAVVLRDAAGTKVVLITLDLLAIRPDFTASLRDALARSLGTSDEQVLVNVSHTHNAPVTRDFYVFPVGDEVPNSAYVAFLKRRILDAVDDANTSLEPVELYAGAGKTDIGVNRHRGFAYYDSTFDVLRAVRADGSNKAILVFHGCHPIKRGQRIQISADFPGFMRSQLEADLGGTALFFQGFGGDVNPSNVEPDVESLGQRLARQVETLLAHGAPRALSGTIDAQHTLLSLALQSPPIPAASSDPSMQRWIELMANPVAAAPEELTELQTIRIGSGDRSWRIAASSHEVVGEWAPLIRSLWPKDHVAVAGYSNSVLSYLPHAQMLELSSLQSFPDGANYEGSESFKWYGLRGPLDPRVDRDYLRAWSTLASPGQLSAIALPGRGVSILAPTSDGQMSTLWQSEEHGWMGWAALPAVDMGGASLLAYPTGEVIGLGIGFGGQMTIAAQDAPGGSWSSRTAFAATLVDGLAAPPAAIMVRGGLSAFGVSTDGRLRAAWQTGTGPSAPWRGWFTLGTGARGTPAALSDDAGRIIVFVRGRADDLLTTEQRSYGGRWTALTSLGGAITDSPTAVVAAGGEIDLFARGADETLVWQVEDARSQWSGWSQLDSVTLAESPLALKLPSGALALIGRTSDGQLLYKQQLGPGGDWAPAELLGPRSATPPTAIVADEGVRLFYRANGAVLTIARSRLRGLWSAPLVIGQGS